MVVTESEFLLVDPHRSRIGWGVVHFIAFLQVRDSTAFLQVYMYMSTCIQSTSQNYLLLCE